MFMRGRKRSLGAKVLLGLRVRELGAGGFPSWHVFHTALDGCSSTTAAEKLQE